MDVVSTSRWDASVDAFSTSGFNASTDVFSTNGLSALVDVSSTRGVNASVRVFSTSRFDTSVYVICADLASFAFRFWWSLKVIWDVETGSLGEAIYAAAARGPMLDMTSTIGAYASVNLVWTEETGTAVDSISISGANGDLHLKSFVHEEAFTLSTDRSYNFYVLTAIWFPCKFALWTFRFSRDSPSLAPVLRNRPDLQGVPTLG